MGQSVSRDETWPSHIFIKCMVMLAVPDSALSSNCSWQTVSPTLHKLDSRTCQVRVLWPKGQACS